MMPDCQSCPAVQAWTRAPRGLAQWLPSILQWSQVGALLNETQARSQSCWAKSKNKFPQISNQTKNLSPAVPHRRVSLRSLPHPVSRCLRISPPRPAVSRLRTTDRQATTHCPGSSPPPQLYLIPTTTVQQHTRKHIQHGAECIVAVRPPVVKEGNSHSDSRPGTPTQPTPCPATTRPKRC